MPTSNLGAGTAVLNLRVVHYDLENAAKVNKVKMKASVETTILTLRNFMSAQANNKPCHLIKLVFNNEVMEDSFTLREYGIKSTAEISVLFDEGNSKADEKLSRTQSKGSGDAKSTGSKRRRNADDMSIASKRTKGNDNMSVSSKRTKVEDSMSVSSVAHNRETDTMSVVRDREQLYKEVTPPKVQKSNFQEWMQQCTIQVGTLVGGKKQNEDAVFSFQSDDGRVSSVGVFDGHGQRLFASVCSRVSLKVTKTWFQRFGAEMPDWEPHTWQQKFQQLFAKLHQVVRDQFEKMENHLRQRKQSKKSVVVDNKGIVRTEDGQPIHGGTTASICVVIRKDKGEQYLVTAYVGDSDVIVARIGAKVNFAVATEGHRAVNKREFMRVQNLPDEFYPIKLNFVYDVHGVKDPRLLPRVYDQNGDLDTRKEKHPSVYGLYSSNVRREPAAYVVSPSNVKDRVRLANTRAIGDFYAHPFGLTYVPEVIMERLPSNESFFIIAGSDGVWDTWEYHDVVDWLQKVTNKEAFKETHVQDFLYRTKSMSHAFFGNMAAVDDSSLCVIYSPKHCGEETSVKRQTSI